MLIVELLKKTFYSEEDKFIDELIKHVTSGYMKTEKRKNMFSGHLQWIEKKTVFDNTSGKKVFEFEYQITGANYSVDSGKFKKNKPGTLFWHKLVYLDEVEPISNKSAYKLYQAILKREQGLARLAFENKLNQALQERCAKIK